MFFVLSIFAYQKFFCFDSKFWLFLSVSFWFLQLNLVHVFFFFLLLFVTVFLVYSSSCCLHFLVVVPVGCFTWTIHPVVFLFFLALSKARRKRVFPVKSQIALILSLLTYLHHSISVFPSLNHHTISKSFCSLDSWNNVQIITVTLSYTWDNFLVDKFILQKPDLICIKPISFVAIVVVTKVVEVACFTSILFGLGKPVFLNFWLTFISKIPLQRSKQRYR